MIFNDFIEKITSSEFCFNVTEDICRHFQCLSGDMNPLHTDTEFAIQKGFPDRIMYGNILNAYISYFVGMTMPCPDVMIQAQDIKFRRPFFMNDNIVLMSNIEKFSKAVECIVFKLEFYRIIPDGRQLVANGHVQIGLLHDKI